MPITVEIEGKGEVAEFPDGTDQAIIDAAIKRDYFTAPAQEPYEDPFATVGTAGQVAGLAAQVADVPLIPLHAAKRGVQAGLRKIGGPFTEPYPAYEGLGIPEAFPAGVMPAPEPTNVGTFREHQVGEYPRPDVTTTMAETLPEAGEFLAVGPYAKGLGVAAKVGEAAVVGGATALRHPLITAGKVGIATGFWDSPLELYLSALKPSTKATFAQKAEWFATAVKNDLPLTMPALRGMRSGIGEIKSFWKGVVKEGAKEGAVLPVSGIVRNLDSSIAWYRKMGLNPAPIEAIKKRFVESWPMGVVPIEEAASIKSGLYRILENDYGKVTSAAKDGMKGLARGIKDETANQFPVLLEKGADQRELISLEKEYQRALGRITNRDITNLTEAVWGVGGAVMSPSKWPAFAAMLFRRVIESPGIKSKVAIALEKRGIPNPMKVINENLIKGSPIGQMSVGPHEKPSTISGYPETPRQPPAEPGVQPPGWMDQMTWASPEEAEAARQANLAAEARLAAWKASQEQQRLITPTVGGQAPPVTVSPTGEPYMGPQGVNAPRIVYAPQQTPPYAKVGGPLGMPEEAAGQATRPGAMAPDVVVPPRAPEIVTRPQPTPDYAKTGAPPIRRGEPTGQAKLPPKPEEFFSMFPGAMAGVETDDQGNQTFSIGKAVAGMVAIGAGAKLVNKMVKAYHGSPTKGIKAFSNEKIGTGEGAQSFGWGHYMTEAPSIAEYYAGKGTSLPTIRRWAQSKGLSGDAIVELSRIEGQFGLISGSGDVRDALNWAKSNLERVKSNHKVIQTKESAEFVKSHQEVVDALEGKYGSLTEASGTVYPVTIHAGKQPGEYTFLEWEKPLSEQPEKIGNALKKLYGDKLDPKDRVLTGNYVYERLSQDLGSPQAASEFLSRAGISGIKYPAGTLSGVKSEAYNYVVFNPEHITMGHVQEGAGKVKPKRK